MKRKTLRRSVALSALMAFAITGSAMAADLVLDSSHGLDTVADQGWVYKDNAGVFESNLYYDKGKESNNIIIDLGNDNTDLAGKKIVANNRVGYLDTTNDNSVTLNSGKVGTIYGVTSSASTATAKNTTIIVNGGEVDSIYAASLSGYKSEVINSKIIINGGKVNSGIYMATVAGASSKVADNSVTLSGNADVSDAVISKGNINGSSSNSVLNLDGWTGSTVKKISGINTLNISNIVWNGTPTLSAKEESDLSRTNINIGGFADDIDAAVGDNHTIIDGTNITLSGVEATQTEKVVKGEENKGVRVHGIATEVESNNLVAEVNKSVLASKYIDETGNTTSNTLVIDENTSAKANILAGAYASGGNDASGGTVTVVGVYKGVVYAGYSEDGSVGSNIVNLGDGLAADELVLYGSNKKDNNGILNVGYGDSSVNSVNNFESIVLGGEKEQTISIGELNGNGTVVAVGNKDNVSVVVGNNNDANLTVKGNSSVTDSFGTDIVSGMQDLADAVEIKDGIKSKDIIADAGSVIGPVTADVDENGNVINVKEKENSNNAGISEMASISLMAWRAENNDMNKRLGELRDSNGEHGVWTRMTRGESEFKSIKNQYNSYQIGYDQTIGKDSNWTVGAAVTYTDGESSFATGNGENTHKGLAMYGSKLNKDGSYIDLIAKYSRLEHEFDVLGGAGKGEYDTNGYSVSVEYGKRFDKDNGFWIEPQVEFTYGKVSSVDYTTSVDVNVHQDSMDSLVGRVGFRIGKDIKQGNVYARASYLYDFDGETSVSFVKDGHRRSFEQDLGGGWFEVGVGTNINLSDATYVYLDVEKTYGGDVATPWQWNAGVRYSF